MLLLLRQLPMLLLLLLRLLQWLLLVLSLLWLLRNEGKCIEELSSKVEVPERCATTLLLLCSSNSCSGVCSVSPCCSSNSRFGER